MARARKRGSRGRSKTERKRDPIKTAPPAPRRQKREERQDEGEGETSRAWYVDWTVDDEVRGEP